jgi:plasmid maintenance system antidote protein VapI
VGKLGERFQKYLIEEFEKKKRINPNFSLRSYARLLDIDASTLSKLMKGTRPITYKSCLKLGNKLGLGQNEIDNLVTNELDSTEVEVPPYKEIDRKSFDLICDWFHYAILELTTLVNFQPNIAWISKVLKVNEGDVSLAVLRLRRLGILKIVEVDGVEKWVDASGDLTTMGIQHSIPSLREMQRQILEKAVDAMDNVPVDLRSQTSVSFPMNRENVSKAKQLIDNFRREFSELMRSSSDCQEIYQLSLSLFPLSQCED